MKSTAELKLALVAVTVLAALATARIASHRNAMRRMEAEVQAAHSEEILSALESTRLLMKNAESRQLSYLLTGEDAYLEPYHHATIAADDRIRVLRELTADSPEQASTVRELESLIASKFVELEEAIRIRESRGLEAAVKLVPTDRSDAIQRLINQMTSRERDVLRGRLTETRASERRWSLLFYSITLLEISLVALGTFLICRFVQQRNVATEATRKLQEGIRQELSAKLASVVETVVEGVIIVDERGVITFANSAAVTMFGHTTEELIGQNIRILMPEPSRSDHDNYLRDYLRTGDAKIIGTGREVEGRRKDGSTFPADLSVSEVRLEQPTGEKHLFTGIIRDITERKRAEQALRQSEQRLRLFIDSAPAAIAMLDTDMRYLAVSRRWLTDFKLTGDVDVIGRSHYEVFPEIPEALKAVHRRSLAGEVVQANEDCFVRADGSVNWLRWETRPWHKADGTVGGIIIFTEDISDLKRAEELRAAKEAAEWASRAKDEFLATISHDLRTPLATIQVCSKLLKHQISESSQSQVPADMIARCAAELSRLVDNLLDSSRLVFGKLQMENCPVNFSDVVRNAVETIRPIAGARDIQLRTPDADLFLLGDASILQRATVNLLSNAIKFTSDRGKVQVRLSRSENEVLLEVIDDGIGINPTFLPKLFERFAQADEGKGWRRGGLGLGLSIVKQFVEAHGGSVQAKSDGAGLGASFTITLPLLVDDPAPEKKEAPGGESTEGLGWKGIPVR